MMRGRTVIASDIAGWEKSSATPVSNSPRGDAKRLAEQMKGVIQADAHSFSTLGATASARANSCFHVNRNGRRTRLPISKAQADTLFFLYFNECTDGKLAFHFTLLSALSMS